MFIQLFYSVLSLNYRIQPSIMLLRPVFESKWLAPKVLRGNLGPIWTRKGKSEILSSVMLYCIFNCQSGSISSQVGIRQQFLRNFCLKQLLKHQLYRHYHLYDWPPPQPYLPDVHLKTLVSLMMFKTISVIISQKCSLLMIVSGINSFGLHFYQ